MSPTLPDKIRYFRSAAEFRKWLESNHGKASELWIGFYKKATGKQSMTYREALDEALCFGWIDGIRKSVDELSFTQRFTPRTSKSNWSHVNVTRVQELIREKRMAPPGLAAFKARSEEKTGQYSYEQAGSPLDEAYEKQFRANPKAWDFFESQPPYYKKTAKWYVMSAKQEATRVKRLNMLIERSAAGARFGQAPTPKQKPER